MPELVPIVRHEMPAISLNKSHLTEALGKCLRLEIPGFKIITPARLAHFARQRHNYNVREIAYTLSEIFPDRQPTIEEFGTAATISQDSVGGLHHDLYPDHDPTLDRTAFDINTCLAGGGAVWLSHFGTDLEAAKGNGDLAHEQLLSGFVDPTIINPQVYTTAITKGDTVVWTDGGQATVWHRFDTMPELGQRIGTLSIINAHDRSGRDDDEVDFPVIKPGIL